MDVNADSIQFQGFSQQLGIKINSIKKPFNSCNAMQLDMSNTYTSSSYMTTAPSATTTPPTNNPISLPRPAAAPAL